MQANEFVKKFGWFTAGDYLSGCAIVDNHLMVFTNVEELKRLVESHELVESHGGLPQSRELAHENCFEYPMRLLQAIVDVESCL